MSTEASTRRYYDDFSSHYDRGRDAGYHALVDRIESSIVIEHAAGMRVLEVGCGTGLVLEKVAPIAASAVGVDLSAGMIGKARARGLEVVRGSATALPFAAASFDVVYSFKVLAHVPEIERALSEIARVTTAGWADAARVLQPVEPALSRAARGGRAEDRCRAHRGRRADALGLACVRSARCCRPGASSRTCAGCAC